MRCCRARLGGSRRRGRTRTITYGRQSHTCAPLYSDCIWHGVPDGGLGGVPQIGTSPAEPLGLIDAPLSRVASPAAWVVGFPRAGPDAGACDVWQRLRVWSPPRGRCALVSRVIGPLVERSGWRHRRRNGLRPPGGRIGTPKSGLWRALATLAAVGAVSVAVRAAHSSAEDGLAPVRGFRPAALALSPPMTSSANSRPMSSAVLGPSGSNQR